MTFKSWMSVVLVVGAVSEVLYFLYKRNVHRRMWGHLITSSASPRIAPNELDEEQTEIFYHVLFFPDAKRSCPEHFWSERGCCRPNCHFTHEATSFSKMVDHMMNAKNTLDVCVYTISNNDLADMVMKLHKRGVIVRVITDDEAVNMSGTFIGQFRRAGIQVRRDYSSYLMHHKFVIIDGKILINGSFNWTCHAVNSNNENALITNNPNIVGPFRDEYEKLWQLFDPSKRPP